MYVKFEGWVLHSEKEIHVQKNKSAKTIFGYICSLFQDIGCLFPYILYH